MLGATCRRKAAGLHPFIGWCYVALEFIPLQRIDEPVHQRDDDLNAYRPGRCFIMRLPPDSDVIKSVEAVCTQLDIQMASFSVTGSVSQLTVGTYDQKQQVYATVQEEGSFDILFCNGQFSRMNAQPAISGSIVAADLNGRLTGGTLFAETRLYAGQLQLQELLAPPSALHLAGDRASMQKDDRDGNNTCPSDDF